ncbi:MAG TPA: malonic semialdehyde reductase [Terriglobales bacterium]|nr:malonic semialdehyde reductase [Terriglobales bacterium]
MGERLDDRGIDIVLRNARSQGGWLDKPVSDEDLRAIYALAVQGPTSTNSCPARFVFVRTPEAKARLLPCVSASNQEKTKQAPVTAIIGYDTRFFELMPAKLYPHRPELAELFAKNAALAETVAFRNGTLQGAWFMIAARALGFDTGGMSGFDNAKVDAAFFPDGRIKSNFLCNVGYGDPSKVTAKLPRPSLDEACRFL